jgi:hypothetical protein
MGWGVRGGACAVVATSGRFLTPYWGWGGGGVGRSEQPVYLAVKLPTGRNEGLP